MSNWKNYFTPVNLRRGRDLFYSGALRSFVNENNCYFVTVNDNGNYPVSLEISHGEVENAKCTCATHRNGSWCKHIASLLWYIEAKYGDEAFKDRGDDKPVPEKKKPERKDVTLTFEDDGKPHYLSFGNSLEKFTVKASTYKKAEEIFQNNQVASKTCKLLEFSDGRYIDYSVNVIEGSSYKAGVKIRMGHNGVVSVTCRDNSKWYDSSLSEVCKGETERNGKIELCVHKTVGFLCLFEFLKHNRDIVDYTDDSAEKLINNFRKERHLSDTPQESNNGSIVDIEPVIEDNPAENECNLTLRINHDGGKYYKVRDIEKLKNLISNGGEYQLGKSNTITFSSSSLSPRAEKVLEFVKKAEIEIILRTRGDYYPGHLKSEISLIQNFDEFFTIMDGIHVMRREIPLLGFRETDPTFTMKIDPLNDAGDIVGISVSGTISGRYTTEKYTYWFQDGWLNRADRKKLGSAGVLSDLADRNGNFSFDVGMKLIDNFYQRVLPEFRKYGRIEDNVIDKIEDRLKEPPTAVFHISTDSDGKISISAAIKDGGEETDLCHPGYYFGGPHYKTKFRGLEDEIDEALSEFAKANSYDEKDWKIKSDDESIYNFLHNGIPLLMDIGSVNVTDDIKKLVVRKMPSVTSNIDIDENDDSILNFTLDLGGLTIEELVEILQSYSGRKKFHRLRNGDFISLEGMNLDSLRDLFISSGISIKDFVDGKMHLPLYRALYLDQILQSQNGLQFEGGQKFRRLIKEFKTISESDYEVPSALSGTLRTYQKDGYRWMRVLFEHGFGGILADDMGLGKTVQALSLLLSLKEEGKGGTTLIVSPASLVFNWKAECTKFTPSLNAVTVTGSAKEREKIISSAQDYDILITSYDLLKRDILLYEGIKFNLEIIDEAQFIKNHNTAQAKAVRAISSKHRLALTGTPIENRLIELWSIFEYLMPGFLFTQESFKKYISNPIEKNGDKEAAARLRKLTGPFILRRIKSDVLKDLPEKIEETRVTPLLGEQKKLYTAEVAKAKGMLKGSKNYNERKIEILAELTRIRQICCDPSLVYSDYKGESSKREATIDLIRSAIDGGHKILLFSQFTSMLSLLEEDLNKEEIPYYKITGETGKAKRIELVDAFNSDDTPLFLISLKAGGTGLNLTAADIVIHYDPWWNIAVQNQATDRAHRIGQTKQVTVYKMICENTIEEKIVKLQETKRDLANEIVSTENMSLSTLTKEDLLELLDISGMA